MAWKGGLRDTLILTATASMVIARETARYGTEELFENRWPRRRLETGGLLVGKMLPNDVYLVTKATGGGPKAQRSSSSFSPDVEYLNKKIEEAERTGLGFIGEWHLHPGSLDAPTGGDHATVREAMADNRLNKFVALIVNLVGKDDVPQLHPYLFQENGRVQRIDYRIIDEREVDSVMPWFMTQDGKKRLLIESRSMSTSFPTMTLRKKEDTIFWEGECLNHRIRLVYPPEYPSKPIHIETIPHAESLPNEPLCYYAVLAAQVARLRIEQKLAEPIPTETIPQPAPSILREPIMPEESTREQWYETNAGKQLLLDLQEQLESAVAEVKTHRLQNGQIVFSCFIDEQGRQSVLIVFPEDFPETQPEVHAYVEGKEVAVKPLPLERWRHDPSIMTNLIQHISSQLRESKQQ